MVKKGLKEDLLWFFGILITFSIVVSVLIPFLNALPQSDYVMGYLAFLIIYSVFIVFVMKEKIDIKLIIGIALLFLVSDIIAPPLLVTQTGIIPNLPNQAQFSSDIFIDMLVTGAFPTIPPIVAYFVVYALIPAILIVIAKHLLSKSLFKQELI